MCSGRSVCMWAEWNYGLCSFLFPLLFQWSSLSNHQSQHTNIGPWESPPLDEGAKKIPPAPAGRVIKICFAELSAAEKPILRCSVRKVQVTMAATAWAALPPGVSSWLHGGDGELSHSSGSPGNLVWGNAAFGQQTALSEAYQGHMQKMGA